MTTRKAKIVSKISTNTFIGLVLLFIYIPVISMIIFSFNSNKSLVKWGGFTFGWYTELFNNVLIAEVVSVTILIAVLATVISTIIGTFGAISIAQVSKRRRNLVMTANNIPIMNPEIITAIALFVLFGALAIPKGFLTLLLAHISFCVPYVLITVYPKVRSLDPDLVDAASDLGATPRQALFKVIIPQIKPSVLAGAIIAFTMSFDDFIISYLAAGSSGIQTISTYLYTLKAGVPPTINALSTIIFLVIGVIVTLNFIRQSKDKKVISR